MERSAADWKGCVSGLYSVIIHIAQDDGGAGRGEGKGRGCYAYVTTPTTACVSCVTYGWRERGANTKLSLSSDRYCSQKYMKT